MIYPTLQVNNWQTIPAGTVTLRPGGYLSEVTSFSVPAFGMARTPVTNGEYGRFIEAGGYEEQDWWPAAGWRLRERYGWLAPRFWDSEEWNQVDRPVVGVSWFEALVYCRWLSQVSGENIGLPTEQQWQRAAQGDDGRPYPWGPQLPDERLCNWNRLVDETTPVERYAAGASPFGLLDMAGNVWEWCLTGWAGDADIQEVYAGDARLVRGGSWSSDSPLSLEVTNRRERDPNTRLRPEDRNQVTVGFRWVVG